MIKFLFFIILLFSVSCSSAAPRYFHKQQGIDPTFNSYIKKYRNIIGKDSYDYKFKKLSMNFANLEGNVIGKCWWLLNGGFEIEIDKEWWDTRYFDDYSREFLVYHELEHCIKYRMHTNRKDKIDNIIDFFEEIGYYMGIIPKPGYLEDGCPASLMHSSMLPYYCRRRHYKHYIKDLK